MHHSIGPAAAGPAGLAAMALCHEQIRSA